MIFIDKEKAYHKVPRDVLCRVMSTKYIPRNYIDLFQDINQNVETNPRTCGGVK